MVLNENEFYYDVNDILGDYFKENFYDNDIFICLFIILTFYFIDVIMIPMISSNIYLTTTATTTSNRPTFAPKLKIIHKHHEHDSVASLQYTSHQGSESQSSQSQSQVQAQAQTQTQHSTAPVINIKTKIGATSVQSREFDNIECIFNGSMDGIDLQCDMLSGMFIFIFIF